MTKDKMIELLNEDLSREYSHWNFYLQAGTNIVGFHRAEFSEFFLEEAASEMKHVEEFKRLIIGLGGEPTCAIAPFPTSRNIHTLLTNAVRMEDEVVTNYVQRIDEAVELQENGGTDKVDGKYIELFLEDQILHSRGDADHMREMIRAID